MTDKMIRNLLDSCFLAKKITEMMPKLPKNVKPRHIHIITSIAISKRADPPRVSDVSNDLNVTMPSITKLINEMELMKIIEKSPVIGDKRAFNLTLTPLGLEYYQTYVVEYHGRLADEFSMLDFNDCQIMINTIKRLYEGINHVSSEKDCEDS